MAYGVVPDSEGAPGRGRRNLPDGLVVGLTGATGHIGGRLLRSLLGAPQVALVRSVARRPLPGAPHVEVGPRLEHVQADLRSRQARRLLGKVDLLFHLGASVWQGRDRRALREMYLVNVEGTANVLDSGAGATVLASSVAVYGAHAGNPLPMDEGRSPSPNRQCPYASQKLACETMCAYHASPRVVARLCAVLGPHADVRVMRGVMAFHAGVPAAWGADQAFQWMHEDDAAAGLLCLGEALLRSPEHVSGQVFNLTTEDWLTEADIAALAKSRVVRLPGPALDCAADLARRAGVVPFGADRSVLVRGPLAASPQKAAEKLGWSAARSSRDVMLHALGGAWSGSFRNRA